MVCPWSCACDPPPPLIKAASNRKPCSRLGGTSWNGRVEGGLYYVSQTCEQQRFEVRKVVFLRSVSIFLQLVVSRSNRRNKTTKRNIEETKRRDEWQIETRKRRQRSEGTMGRWDEATKRHEETAKLRKLGAKMTERSNEVTKSNDETTKRTFCPRFDFIKFWP